MPVWPDAKPLPATVIWDPRAACGGTVRDAEAALTLMTADTVSIAAAVRAKSRSLRDGLRRIPAGPVSLVLVTDIFPPVPVRSIELGGRREADRIWPRAMLAAPEVGRREGGRSA